MATVARESIGELHDKLVVTLSKEDYYPPFEKALKQYGKSANISGFRKGMVPTGMIRKMYGQSVFAQEVVRKAQQEVSDYLKEYQPDIFGQPLSMKEQDVVLDMNTPEDVNIAFEIGLKPEFDIPLLKEKGKLTHYTILVDDEMLRKETENLQRRMGELNNPKSPEEPTDMVYSTYVPCDEAGNTATEAVPTEDVVLLNKLPQSIADAVKGQKQGFTYVFQPAKVCEEDTLESFMKDAVKRDISEKDNYFKFTLDKTGRLAPAEMNEEFFKKVFPNDTIETEEQFSAKLTKELEKEAAKVAKNKLENDIFETLVHETPMKLPEGFLKRWLLASEEAASKTEEEVEQSFPDFIHRLRWTLISDKLMKHFNIEISKDEVMDHLKGQVVDYFGMMNEDEGQPSWLQSYLDKIARDEKTIEETYARLKFDKLFTTLAETLEVKKETVDEETFAKLQPEHHHHHHA